MHLLSYTEKNGVAKLEEICLFTTYLYTTTISPLWTSLINLLWDIPYMTDHLSL